jgi:hypothetical protein
MPRRHRSDYASRRGEEGWYEVSGLTDDESRPWVFTSHTGAANQSRTGHMPLICPGGRLGTPLVSLTSPRSESGLQQARRVALTTAAIKQ